VDEAFLHVFDDWSKWEDKGLDPVFKEDVALQGKFSVRN